MKKATLPDIGEKTILPEYFPTAMQSFIFRNWEMVSKEKIAEVLETTVENVVLEAERMGLGAQENTDVWMEKGYITIIRANWHLLPYEQIMTLLGWDDEKLSHILKEEDFLDIKLGNFKPACEKVGYCVLTAEELAKTARIKKTMQSVPVPMGAQLPFDFWSKKQERISCGAPMDGCVVLDGTWTVENATGDAVVSRMAKRFEAKLGAVWGVSLGGRDKKIVLNFVGDKAEEYHILKIDSGKIEISAGGSAGVLRGLYRLLDLMQANNGPYLEKGTFERKPRFGARYIYSFCALYEGAFDVDSATYCPDALLEQYAETGVNGIWLQAVLYRMTEFPFDKAMSDGWEARQQNLRNFVKRAKEFGIKIYLYINEPRTMPLSFFETYPDMKGAVTSCGRYATMCLTNEKCQNYLSGAVQSLCRAVPGLGGFFTITMSENMTHCKSRKTSVACPHCADKEALELAALANRLIAEGAHRADENVLVIAWDWAWDMENDADGEIKKKYIQSLPESVALMTKRETRLAYERGGVAGEVSDYAMSVEGLSPHSVRDWGVAMSAGLPTVAKLQINNSWECSTTPYLPIYKTLIGDMNRLIEFGIDHLMLSWTLGGYPSPNIKLISESFFAENGKAPDYDMSYKILYGDSAKPVKAATDIFCAAFGEFPFDIRTLYYGPQNAGVSNPLYSQPTGYEATMTCYAYDDLEKWRSIYPVDVFEKQFKLVSEKWEEGLALLGDEPSELSDIAYISYMLFKSSYNQIRFIRLRDAYLKNASEERRVQMRAIVENEREIAAKTYEIMCLRPAVGFEAANHYYFNRQMILEKLVNCDWLLELYK